MTREELIEELKMLPKHYDPEANHSDADRLLLKFINDDEVSAAFHAINKWYA